MKYRSINMEQRLATLLTWFDTEPNRWPNFANIYWDILDGAGHQTGPYSKKVRSMWLSFNRRLLILTAAFVTAAYPPAVLSPVTKQKVYKTSF